jgi:hypothetical protein
MTKYKSLYDVQRAIEQYDGMKDTVDYVAVNTVERIRDIMARPDEPPQDTRHNGWTNYPTWRINLEIWSDENWGESGLTFAGLDDLATHLEEQTDEILTNWGENESGLALDYARSFVSGVNWDELAEHYAADFPGLIESDDDDDDDTEGDA